jgi:hypothetical protein
VVLRAIPVCRKDGVRTASELTSELRRRIIRKVRRIVRQVIERIFRHFWRVARHHSLRRVARHHSLRRVARHHSLRRVARHHSLRRVAGHSRRVVNLRHATTLQRRLLKSIAEIYVMKNILEHAWPDVLSVRPRAISTSWVDGFRTTRELT